MFLKTKDASREVAVFKSANDQGKHATGLYLEIRSKYGNQQRRTYTAVLDAKELTKLTEHLLEILPPWKRKKLVEPYITVI